MSDCCPSSQMLDKRQNKRRHSITYKNIQSLDDHICNVAINCNIIENRAVKDDNKDTELYTTIQRNSADNSLHDININISNLDNDDAANKCIITQAVEPVDISNVNWQHEVNLGVDLITSNNNIKTNEILNCEEPIKSEVAHNPEIINNNEPEPANNLDVQISDSDDFPVPEGWELLIDADEDPELAAKIDAELHSNIMSDPEERVIATPYIPPIVAGLEYTLVLDLDETLIHYKDEEEFYLVRPGVNMFLQELSACYNWIFNIGIQINGWLDNERRKHPSQDHCTVICGQQTYFSLEHIKVRVV